MIVQGFLQLLEPEVTIHARESDLDAAKQAAEAAATEYHEISGKDVKYEVVSSLSAELYVRRSILINRTDAIHRAGGVKLVNGNNRITLDNTLDERLRLLEDRVRLLSSFAS